MRNRTNKRRQQSRKPSTKLMTRNQIQYRVYALEQGVEVKGDGTRRPLSPWKRQQYELQIKAWKARTGLLVYTSIRYESMPNPMNKKGQPDLPPVYFVPKDGNHGPAIRNRLRSIEPEAPQYFTRSGYREYLEALVVAADKQLEPFDPRTHKPREVAPQMVNAMGYARNMAMSELAANRY